MHFFSLVCRQVQYFFSECDSAALLTAEPNVAGIESFTVSTDTALFTLATDLDYEVATRYVVIATVVDSGSSPARTGTIVVRVRLSNLNEKDIYELSSVVQRT